MLCALLVLMLTWGWEDAQLRVDRPRPVLAAVRILEDRYGWITNYEDPPYTNPGDIVEFTPTFIGARKMLEPRSGRIEIAFPLLATGMPESHSTILQMIIDDHTRRDNAGRFRIHEVGGMQCVVPAQGSILNVPVTLASKQRTFQEVVEDLIAAIRTATGLRFRSPVVSRASSDRFPISAAGEPASSVLVRLFGEAGGGYSWALLYIPDSGFELNIHGKQ